MALGSVYVEFAEKFPSGAVLSMGRLFVGNQDVIRATDLRMNQIKSFAVMPYGQNAAGSALTNYARGHVLSQGSLGSVTNFGSSNYVFLLNRRLHVNLLGTTVHAGTLRGSQRLTYIASGF